MDRTFPFGPPNAAHHGTSISLRYERMAGHKKQDKTKCAPFHERIEHTNTSVNCG